MYVHLHLSSAGIPWANFINSDRGISYRERSVCTVGHFPRWAGHLLQRPKRPTLKRHLSMGPRSFIHPRAFLARSDSFVTPFCRLCGFSVVSVPSFCPLFLRSLSMNVRRSFSVSILCSTLSPFPLKFVPSHLPFPPVGPPLPNVQFHFPIGPNSPRP